MIRSLPQSVLAARAGLGWVQRIPVWTILQSRNRGLVGVGNAKQEAEPRIAVGDLEQQAVPALLELEGDIELVGFDRAGLVILVDPGPVEPGAAAVVVTQIKAALRRRRGLDVDQRVGTDVVLGGE